MFLDVSCNVSIFHPTRPPRWVETSPSPCHPESEEKTPRLSETGGVITINLHVPLLLGGGGQPSI